MFLFLFASFPYKCKPTYTQPTFRQERTRISSSSTDTQTWKELEVHGVHHKVTLSAHTIHYSGTQLSVELTEPTSTFHTICIGLSVYVCVCVLCVFIVVCGLVKWKWYFVRLLAIFMLLDVSCIFYCGCCCYFCSTVVDDDVVVDLLPFFILYFFFFFFCFASSLRCLIWAAFRTKSLNWNE